MEKEIIKAYCWIRENNHTIPDEVLDLMKDSAIKTLQGIETNNGWIKIESDEDLPNSNTTYCWTIDEKGNIRKDLYYNSVYKVFQETFPYIKNVKVTHYQPIVKPLPPLY